MKKIIIIFCLIFIVGCIPAYLTHEQASEISIGMTLQDFQKELTIAPTKFQQEYTIKPHEFYSSQTSDRISDIYTYFVSDALHYCYISYIFENKILVGIEKRR